MSNQNQSRIAELASIISNHTEIVDRYLQSQELHSPSFDCEYTEASNLPAEIVIAKNKIVEATEELNSLMLGPIGLLTNTNTTLLPSLQFIYRYKVASLFPINEEISFATVAKIIGMGIVDTERILRMAISNRFFREPRTGILAHTSISKILATTPLLDSWIGLLTDEIWLASSKMLNAMAKWPDSDEANQTGYNLAASNDDTYFDGIKKDPVRAKRFDEVMTFFHAGGAFERAGLLDHYDWEPMSQGTVVELGGSHGQMCVDLAKRYPKMKCISQDLPEVIAAASIPEYFKGQVQLIAHDFFTEQPVKGADAYLFRWIFHDWSDKYSLQILKNLIPALKNGAKIIIGELCIPDPNSVSLFMDRRMRSSDLVMKACLNGKERNANEWAGLFAKSDPRFKFQGVLRIPNSRFAVMEAIWVDESGPRM